MQYTLREPATDENFHEENYLRGNPDVMELVQSGTFRSGRDHFDAAGKLQHRYLQAPPSLIAHAKRAKLERIRPLLRKELPMVEREGAYDFLSEALRAEFSICDTKNVSDHPYDSPLMDLVTRHTGGLVLDCGAGRRPVYFENVVNFEIVPYDSTDVLGVGEELPFKDHSFDAVISIAVLEHVKDPWRCAREIIRVLKPGGELICAVPFLQPVHGYPNHYYNMTAQGLQTLFDHALCVDRTAVTEGMGPVHALTWILRSWSEGLFGNTRENFLNMQVRDLTGHGALYMDRPFTRELPEEKNFELAAACILFAHKPRELQAAPGTEPLEMDRPSPGAKSDIAPYDPLEVPPQEGPVLASLVNFQPVCQPLIEAWAPRSICEIGVENGRATEWLVNLSGALGGEYHGVDPTIDTAPSPVGKAGHAHFHCQPSLGYLAEAPPHDVYFIDGDHNYHTVSNELSLIAKSAAGAERAPLIFLHDVSWPWARRDLYYRWDDIPEEARQESSQGNNFRVDQAEPVDTGGFQPAGTLYYARKTSRDRNGVLTAVEDFLASQPDWEFLTLPNFFGLGILVARNELEGARAAAVDAIRTSVNCLSTFLKWQEYNRVELITNLEETKTRLHLAEAKAGTFEQERIRLMSRIEAAQSEIHAAKAEAHAAQAETRTAQAQTQAARLETHAAHLEIHAARLDAQATRAQKDTEALYLNERLRQAAAERTSLKEALKEAGAGHKEWEKQFKAARHQLRSLLTSLVPSSRRKKAARAFLAEAESLSIPRPVAKLPTRPAPKAEPAEKEPGDTPALPSPAPPPAAPENSLDALDFYETKAPSSQNILDIFEGEWSSEMPGDSGLVSVPGPVKLFEDARIHWAAEILGGFADQNVLELGPLEGAHSRTLQSMGAKKVTAIEANRHAFLKCLCIKEIFQLDRVSFQLGDFVTFLRESTGRYDAIVACGVLYHMTDPIELIDLISRHTDRVFLWTHHYDDLIVSKDYLARRFQAPVSMDYHGWTYKGAQQSYMEAVQASGFCGGSQATSCWLTRQSILNALTHFGFTNLVVGFEDPDHVNGPAIAICAQR